METLREYITIAEAARTIGVSTNTLRKWAAEGKIAVRVNPANKYRLFLRSDLKNFLAKLAKPTRAVKPHKDQS